jgi:hypothetical protein
VKAAALLLVALALAACEASQETNAKLERIAKREAEHRPAAQRGLSITKLSTKLTVLATAVVGSSEGAAAIVTVRNSSATALRGAPIAITVMGARDGSTYRNDIPGLAKPLVSLPLVPAHGELTWVDDQIPAGSYLASPSAKLGEGDPTSGQTPRLSVSGIKLFDERGSEPNAEGDVISGSRKEEREVVVYAVARRGGKIVAAGSAFVPQVATGAGTRFQLYFIGNLRGARLQFSAVDAAA